MRVSVVDYGIGNLYSVQRAFETCGAEVTLSSDPAQIADARRLLTGREILDLTYEDDIADDPHRAYRRICDFLGVTPEPVEVRYGRTTPFPLSGVIENFDEVKAALASTEFEWMLAE